MHAYIVHKLEFTPDLYTLEITAPTTMIGIDQVRDIQRFLSTQTAIGHKRTIVIHAAHNLTLPAQNALLKTLEEPGGETNIYLLTDQPDSLLPTILSRCQIIQNQADHLDCDESLLEPFKKLVQQSIPQRLLTLENEDFDRNSALQFLRTVEIWLHQTKPDKCVEWYAAVIKTKHYLKANCNVKICMDCFAFNL